MSVSARARSAQVSLSPMESLPALAADSIANRLANLCSVSAIRQGDTTPGQVSRRVATLMSKLKVSQDIVAQLFTKLNGPTDGINGPSWSAALHLVPAVRASLSLALSWADQYSGASGNQYNQRRAPIGAARK